MLSRLPLDCAEVFLQTESEYTRSFARKVKQNLNGLPCTSMHPLGTLFENQLISRSPRQRKDARNLLCRTLDAGAELGAKLYVHHGRNTPRNEVLPWNMSANAEMIGLIEEEAVKRDMHVAWENVCWCQLTTPERVKEALEAAPQLHFTLDIKQAMKAGCNPMDFVYAMGKHLANVHICDWDQQGKLCLPGEGAFDFAALVSALDSVGYTGALVIEPYLALIRDDEALARSIGFMKRIINRAE